MSLIVRKPTPGEQAYADWCDAPESDLARYWHRMNRADKAKWEKFGARVAADRGAVAENEKLRLQIAALENDGMELAAKLGEAEEQIARLTATGDR